MLLNKKNDCTFSVPLINVEIYEVKLHGYEGGGSGIYFKILNLSSDTVELAVDKCYVINNGSMISGAIQNNVGYLGTNAEKLEPNIAMRSYAIFRWDTIYEFQVGDEVVLSVLDVINCDEYKYIYNIQELEDSTNGKTILLTSKMNIANMERKKFEFIDKFSRIPTKQLNKYFKSKVERFEALEERLSINISNVSFELEIVNNSLFLKVFIEVILVGDIQSNKVLRDLEITAYNKENDIVGTAKYNSIELSQTKPLATCKVEPRLNEFPSKIRILAS